MVYLLSRFYIWLKYYWIELILYFFFKYTQVKYMYILFLFIDFILPLSTTQLMFAHAIFFLSIFQVRWKFSNFSTVLDSPVFISLIAYLLGSFLSSRLHWIGRNFDGCLSLSILYFFWISMSILLHPDIVV